MESWVIVHGANWQFTHINILLSGPTNRDPKVTNRENLRSLCEGWPASEAQNPKAMNHTPPISHHKITIAP